MARLEETRLRALERRIEADLAVGEHERTIQELHRLAAEHPLRAVGPDTDTGRSIAGVDHRHDIEAVAWRSDGARLAAGHDDGRIRLWEPDTGREVLELRGHDDEVVSIAFNHDGSRLVSGDSNGQARVWALTIDELVDIARDELMSSHADTS